MTVTASFLVGQHVHERTAQRVERVWLEGAGVGAFRRVHMSVYVRCVRRERRQSAAMLERGPCHE